MERTTTSQLIVLSAMIVSLLSLVGHAETLYWVGDGVTNTWDETSTAWQTGNPGVFSATDTYTDTVDAVIFDRDTTTNTTVTVRAAGVTPVSLQIDTGVHWTFQPETAGAGKINAYLNHAPTSGAATSLTFNYDSSPGFTGAALRAGLTNWVLSASATAGSYTFLTGTGGPIELANYVSGGAPGFNMNVAAAGAGDYIVTDDFVVKDQNNGGVFNATLVAGQTVTYAGDIDLQQQTLYSNVNSTSFTGTVTFTGDRTFRSTTTKEGVTIDFSGATIDGGGVSNISLLTGNGNYRGFQMPDSGARLDIVNLSVTQSYITFDAANPAEDYFATLRDNGGRVSFSGASINQPPAYPTKFLSGVFDAGVMDFATGQTCGFDVTVGADGTILFTPGPVGSFSDGIDLRAAGNGGDLTAISGAAIEIVLSDGMEEGTYRLFDMDSLTGTFDLVLDPMIKDAVLVQNSTSIDLVVNRIPEPTTAVLVGIMASLCLRRRRQ